MILTRYEFRTDNAVTPITFKTPEEAYAWKANMSKKHEFFVSIIKLYKVTTEISEELIPEVKLYKTQKRGFNK